MAWQALVDGHAPKSSNDLAIAAADYTCDTQEVQGCEGVEERLTAWSLKVAGVRAPLQKRLMRHKIFVVREMLPKDIKREFLTGPRKIDEIMEKLEIIVNEMMADDGPVPMDLVNVGAYDAKTTQSDSDTSNDMSYEDVCAIAWKQSR